MYYCTIHPVRTVCITILYCDLGTYVCILYMIPYIYVYASLLQRCLLKTEICEGLLETEIECLKVNISIHKYVGTYVRMQVHLYWRCTYVHIRISHYECHIRGSSCHNEQYGRLSILLEVE